MTGGGSGSSLLSSLARPFGYTNCSRRLLLCTPIKTVVVIDTQFVICVSPFDGISNSPSLYVSLHVVFWNLPRVEIR